MVNGAKCFAWAMVGFSACALAAAGCGDSVPATPQATVISSLVGPGAAGSAACPLSSGTDWADMPKTKDGDSVNGASVRVNCKVSGSDSSGYDVTAAVALSGLGSITISGHVTTSTDPQPGISASFQGGPGPLEGFGPFAGTCSVQFPADKSGGIAAGRVGVDLSCPSLVDSNHGKECKGTAQLIFENCAQ